MYQCGDAGLIPVPCLVRAASRRGEREGQLLLRPKGSASPGLSRPAGLQNSTLTAISLEYCTCATQPSPGLLTAGAEPSHCPGVKKLSPVGSGISAHGKTSTGPISKGGGQNRDLFTQGLKMLATGLNSSLCNL